MVSGNPRVVVARYETVAEALIHIHKFLDGSSIPDETRCQTCSNRHREYQKQARERAAQKREQASGQTHVRVGKPNVAKSWVAALNGKLVACAVGLATLTAMR